MRNEDFKNEIERFLTETGMAASSFGRMCMSDPKFVDRIRSGSECREATQDRVLAWIAEFRAPSRAAS